MRNPINVVFSLDRILCYDEADGWGSAEPYLWTVFFKIDGNTVRLNEGLMLEGTATIFTTPGSHGNLGDTDVDGGDTVNIPDSIGYMQMTCTPIPVAASVQSLVKSEDLPAIAGCVVVLMEEDNVSDDGADAGHDALNNAVQNALDSIIPTLGFSKRDVTDDDIKALTDAVQSKVEDAVKNQQNIFENIWSWLNPDDTIGTKVWKFDGDTLLANNPTMLDQRWPNPDHPSSDNGDWEIFGQINTAETCPASVIQDILNSLFGNNNGGGAQSGETINAMHEFRAKELTNYSGLLNWWKLAQRHTPLIRKVLTNNSAAAAPTARLFKKIPAFLKDKNALITDEDVHDAADVLKAMLSSGRGREPRKDLQRMQEVLQILKGKTVGQVLGMLSSLKPARYPRIESLGSDFRLQRRKAAAPQKC